jgi:hemerythrin-like domain-containing protein
MQYRAPLMIEHRLIEQMIALIEKELTGIAQLNKSDPVFIDTVVDFIRIYADRTHHGKEEDILFRELKKKSLNQNDSVIMNELIEEHIFGRKITAALVDANNRYRNGDASALMAVAEKLRIMADFYPKHIIKEDKVFFPSVMQYLSEKEQKTMLDEFWEFDRQMIHEKYRLLVDTLKKRDN